MTDEFSLSQGAALCENIAPIAQLLRCAFSVGVALSFSVKLQRSRAGEAPTPRHTYNSLGDFEKAEDYLRQALVTSWPRAAASAADPCLEALKFIEQEAGMNKASLQAEAADTQVVTMRFPCQQLRIDPDNPRHLIEMPM